MKVLPKLLLLALLAVCSVSCLSQTPSTDPYVGIWKLNKEKSEFRAGPAPKNTPPSIMEANPGGGLVVTIHGVDDSGKPVTHRRVELFDARPHKVIGDLGAEEMLFDRPDEATITGFSYRKGEVTARFKRVMSPDGNTMTIWTKGIDRFGKKFDDVRIYERVDHE